MLFEVVCVNYVCVASKRKGGSEGADRGSEEAERVSECNGGKAATQQIEKASGPSTAVVFGEAARGSRIMGMHTVKA